MTQTTPAAGSELLTIRLHQISLSREIGCIRPVTQEEDRDFLVQFTDRVQEGALIRPVFAEAGDYQGEDSPA